MLLKNKDVFKYVLMSLFASFNLMASVEMLFFEYKSLSLSQIYMIYSLYSIVIVLVELPTGYLSDKFGAKTSMLVGLICGIIASIGFILGQGFVFMLISYIFIALMISFFSGSDVSYLYDSLTLEGDVDRFDEVYGKISSYCFVAVIVGAFLGGIIANINMLLVVAVDVIFLVAALIVFCTANQPKVLDNTNPHFKTCLTEGCPAPLHGAF